MTPLEVVNRRMQAYNSHHLEDFLATYADDVKVYTYPNTLLGDGKTHIKNLFEPLFKKQSVHVVIHHQIAKDAYVINHETVTYNDEEAETEYVSIYEIRHSLIQHVQFVRD